MATISKVAINGASSLCKINILSTFRMVDFLKDFCLIRKYSKYSLNLTFGWECNDTPSLNEFVDISEHV